MSIWDRYPEVYRFEEIRLILNAVGAGDCVAVVGLSGSGKSNLVGFLANRAGTLASVHADVAKGGLPQFVLVDCNRLVESSSSAFYRLARRELAGFSGCAQAVL